MEIVEHTFELYQQVSLVNDFPEHKLMAGDIATLVEIVRHPEDGKENSAVLEVFNARGNSLFVATVPISCIASLGEDEVLSVRKLASCR